tara:strand:- start:4648 stop:4818 length:171 start_codon:yes stop_codon:yes gene_type:complete
LKNVIVVTLMPFFFATVLVVGFYFLARLGLTLSFNNMKLRRRKLTTVTSPKTAISN